jgi:hypothetical protein
VAGHTGTHQPPRLAELSNAQFDSVIDHDHWSPSIEN